MNDLDRDRWGELWRVAGVRMEMSNWYERLNQLFIQPHRHYHNGQHVADCLREFDSARHLAHQPLAVELAIWFHDAIYDPHASDNEEQSADLAKQCLFEAGLDKHFRESVADLVLATKQHDASSHADAPLVVDVDLSILGQPPERFWQYESQIRKEYGWVLEDVFAAKRAEILERFLSREKIYATEYFFMKYERQARVNLSESVEKLRRR